MSSGPIQRQLATCLSRIASEDRHWHAMLALNPQVERDAVNSDLEAALHGKSGLLHGFILGVKDNIDVAGMATSSGCKALAHAMPHQDAEVIHRLRQAGALVIGKTNLSEFSFEIRSRSSLGGDVRCPFAPHATAGGSSGGSAVALACGFADGALGTDTGGSIRIPAACNGLVGFRPAHGALPMAGIAPLAPSTDTVGPIARNVEDALLLYRAMGGVVEVPATLRKMRVGVLRQAFGDDPAIRQTMEKAADRLDHHGVQLVDPVVIDGLETLLAGPHIVDLEFATAFSAYLARNFQPGTAPASLTALMESGDYLPEYQATLERRLTATPDAAQEVLNRHHQLAQAMAAMMAHHQLDALLYPTMQVIPEDLGTPKGGWAPELAARSGWPAITVPVAPHDAPRPIGGELLAPAGSEGVLFALARVIGRA
jgi:Asp-tRNA(Asn)/Glu-tRNA(Gln) amidotransferase A subunit family amidase